MRDSIKSKEYFLNIIEDNSERITKYSEKLEKISSRGLDDAGVQVGYIILDSLYKNQFIAMYSVGKSIDKEIKDTYFKWIEKAEIVSNDEYSYVDLLWLVSIAILLDLKEEVGERLKNMVKKLKMDDGFIQYLFSPSKDNLDKLSFFMPKPYSEWGKIITASDDEKIILIKKYLTSKWYKSHYFMGWYNSHLSDEDIYSGYWSLESGAVVKILGLDDSELKDVAYYPYDLVHYSDNK